MHTVNCSIAVSRDDEISNEKYSDVWNIKLLDVQWSVSNCKTEFIENYNSGVIIMANVLKLRVFQVLLCCYDNNQYMIYAYIVLLSFDNGFGGPL